MLPFLRLSLLIIAFAPCACAVVETVVQSAENSTTLQLSSFSVNPAATVSGELAEFSVVVSSFANTVSRFQATIFIYDSGGSLAGTMEYADSAIAGGETQAITKFWDTAGRPNGSYRAFINATYGNGTTTNTRNVEFSIVPPIAPIAIPATINTTTGVPGAPEITAQHCTDFFCGEWGECADGYRSQACILPPECLGKDFFRVEKCPPADDGRAIERKICTALPQACEPQGQEQNYICACLPSFLAAIVFFTLLVIRRALRRRF